MIPFTPRRAPWTIRTAPKSSVYGCKLLRGLQAMSQKGKLEAKAINLKPSQLEIPFVLQTKSNAKRRNSADLHKFIYLFHHENRKWMTKFTVCTVSFPFFLFLFLKLFCDKNVTLFIWSLQPSLLEKSFFGSC